MRLDLGERQPVSTFDTEQEARLFLAEWEVDRLKGLTTTPSEATLGALIAEWLQQQTTRLRPSTFSDYEQVLRTHVLRQVGSARVQKLTVQDIDRYLQEREAAGVSPAIRQKARMRIAQVLDYAMERNMVYRNVARVAKPPRVVRKEMQVWDLEQARRFVAAARRSIYAPYWDLALTGMRRGEVLGLRWQDVDLAHRVIRVRQSKTFAYSTVSTLPPKSGKPRVLDIDPELCGILAAHQEAQAKRFPGVALVCTSTVGTLIFPHTLHEEFKRLTTDAGLPRIRIHDLRHTAGSLMLANGVPMKVVQERLGHSSIKITGDVYAHVLPGMGQQAAALMGGLLYSPPT